jgi:endonuclease YncB( thermonuclease family)
MDCPYHLGQPIGLVSLKIHLSGFVIVVAALILVFVALSFGKARLDMLDQRQDADRVAGKNGVQTTQVAPNIKPAGAETSTAVRHVQPQIFAPPETGNAASLERIAPRAPLTPVAAKASEPASNVIEARSVVAPDGGSLMLGKHRMILAGMIPLALDETCRDAHGSTWPCGMSARTALRGYLRNRLVRCIPDPALTETVKAVCSVGGQNIASWMIENGWARAEPTSPFSALATEAQDRGLGLNGLDPRIIIDDSLTKEMEDNDPENNSP